MALTTPRPERLDGSFRTSDGQSIRYAVDDFAPPWRPTETILLLHANMGSMARFRAWVPILAQQFRVVRWDMRGHGGSSLPGADAPLSIERLGQDVVELLDHLGIARAHLAGSSTGGIIAMHTAIAHPARVATLASFAALPGLANASGRDAYIAWTERLERDGVRALLEPTLDHRFDLATTDRRLMDWWVDVSAATDARFAAQMLRMLAGVDLSDRLDTIRCPALFVVPDADPDQSPENYFKLRAVPDHRFVVLQGARHNITDAVPERCAAELLAFLRERAPTNGRAATSC